MIVDDIKQRLRPYKSFGEIIISKNEKDKYSIEKKVKYDIRFHDVSPKDVPMWIEVLEAYEKRFDELAEEVIKVIEKHKFGVIEIEESEDK